MERPLTNISYIKDLCERYGFRFDKKFGQNFIVNPSVCPRMVDYSGIDENSGVIEIGTGFGTLTRELSRAAGKVVAIEDGAFEKCHLEGVFILVYQNGVIFILEIMNQTL